MKHVDKIAEFFHLIPAELLGYELPDVLLSSDDNMAMSHLEGSRTVATPTDRVIAVIELGWHTLQEASEVLGFQSASELEQRMRRTAPDSVLVNRLNREGITKAWVEHGDPDGLPGGLAIAILLDRPWVSRSVQGMVERRAATSEQSDGDNS
jgi:hypothetical protein